MNTVASIPNWLQQSGARPALANAPEWLINFRQTAWDDFLKNGLPTRKDERWKYADLSFLANKNYVTAKQIDVNSLRETVKQHRLKNGESILLVLVNGSLAPELSDVTKLPKNANVCSISEAITKHADLIHAHWPASISAQQYPFAALNAAMFVDGLFFYLPDGTQLETPIHLLSLVDDDNDFIAQPHNLIILGKQSKMVFTEEHHGLVNAGYFMNIVTSIHLHQDAVLEQYKLQRESLNATHMANTFIYQHKNSDVSLVNITTGGLFSRDDVVVKLQEAGANCKTSGFYRLRYDNQYIDHHIDINHQAAHSQSEMLYKGIADKKSRAVFNGRLHIEKDAQKILAYQANHNLLLSNDAEIYSKPELEIYADDVKCKHGATTGQIDEEALFYLRSRGIQKADAINIMLAGFSEEVLKRVTHAAIRQRAQEYL